MARSLQRQEGLQPAQDALLASLGATRKFSPQRFGAALQKEIASEGRLDIGGVPSLLARSYVTLPPPTPARQPSLGTGPGDQYRPRPSAAPRPTQKTAPQKGVLQIPTSWKPTHETDGLGWGTKSAIDLMAAPGTRVAAPVEGTVVYFNPSGAQGGGSMLLRDDSGGEWWLGHIANGLPAGSRVKRGQQLAVVSADHPAPHLHLDRR